MNETVREWFQKAEADARTAKREFDAVDSPNYDAVCFHSQQCIEKMMKGILVHHRVTFTKTHDLVQVFELLKTVCRELECSDGDLRFLTSFGVSFRYPGESADREDAQNALEVCERLCMVLDPHLPSE